MGLGHAIAGVGLSRFGQIHGTSAMGFTLQACKRAIEDAGIDKRDVDGCLVTMPAVMGEQHGWATRVAAHLGLEPRVCATVDMGGATPIGLVQMAGLYVGSGAAKAVLCCFGMQNNPQGVIPMLMGSQFAVPHGDIGAITYMAHIARRQMYEQGVTSEDYGHVAVTFRRHASQNPFAQKREPITLEEHQRSRWVVEPLRLLDCCLVTDGGGALLVTSVERARDLARPPVLVLGEGQEHGAELILPLARSSQSLLGACAADRAFAQAGVSRDDVDALFLYDGFTPLVLHELEAFGFCGRGEAGALVRGGTLSLGGKLPTNTNGGLLSEGHLFGVGHIVEAVRQVRGECGPRQVRDAEVVFVSGYGGAPHESPPTVSSTAMILGPDRARWRSAA